jgi:hypothetical protein
VKRGERRDVSCGYTCDFDETPGVFDGVAYARVQRDRIYNHLGIGPEGWGRAGTDVSLRLDGAQETAARFDAPVSRIDSATAKTASTTGGASRVASDHPEGRMKIKIRGREYKLDADAEVAEAQKTVDAMEAESVPKKDADAMAAQQSAKLAAMEALIAQLTKEIAELKSTVAAEESSEVTEADVPEAVADSIVSKRLARLDAAREGARLIAPAVKLDGLMKPREVHAAAIVAAMPTMKLDGLSDDGVAGVFAGLVEPARAKAAKRVDGARKASEVLTPSKEQSEDVAREDGSETAEHNPIADQQAALRAWSKRS